MIHRWLVDAVKAARTAGFDNLNLDLIFGIPDQTLEDWRQTLTTALDLQPEHVSLYGLELKGGTPLRLAVDDGSLSRPDDDLSADMYDLATHMMGDYGYEQYEISNWCKPGYEARHNLQYWRNLPYLGLGPGAHGYAGGIRYSVMTLPQRYIDALQKQFDETFAFPRTPAVAKITEIDRETEMADTIMMGLRLTREGIQRHAFTERFGIDLFDLHHDSIQKFMAHDLMSVDDTTIRLTQAGRYVSNGIIAELI